MQKAPDAEQKALRRLGERRAGGCGTVLLKFSLTASDGLANLLDCGGVGQHETAKGFDGDLEQLRIDGRAYGGVPRIAGQQRHLAEEATCGNAGDFAVARLERDHRLASRDDEQRAA